ncbi:MAG: restriction endonuclease subunit S [Bacilli bacterium]|nr:restriction endonuclease subunit S [Bacilli bacterium]
MSKVKLKRFLTEYSVRNKSGKDYPVYSVTNSNGFCTEYFTKDVSSNDKTNYKIVPFGYFAYNPSRINVGSVDCQEVEENVIVSPLYNVFKCSESLDRHYLKYFFKSRYGQNLINANTSGSVRANLKFKTLCEFEISNRSLNEQKEAVEIFENINNLIENEKHSLFLLDELIKSRFNEMFSKIIYSGDRETNFGSICDGIIGLTYKPDNISDEGTIVLRSGNIQNNNLQIIDDVVRVSNINIPDEKMVRDLDILMCARNGSARLVGKTCIIRNPTEQMTFGAFMTIIRTKYPYILHHYMNSDFFRIQLKSTQTASVNQITNGMLKEYSVFSPTDAEEKQFRSFVEQIDKLKFNVQKRIDYYQELLNKKMDEYFN